MGRRSIKEERQKEIVKAFYTVAKKEGLENASIAKVAKQMNTTPSLVMHYFKSKDELVYALVQFNLERYLAIYSINGEIDSKEKLLELIDNLFSKKWHRLFDDGLFYNLYSQTYRNEKFKSDFKALHDALHTNLSDRLIASNEKGITHIENIPEAVAVIYAVVDGAYYYLGMATEQTEILERTDYYIKHVKKVLGIRQ